MRIAEIQTAVIEANYDWTIVKVRTDDGLAGWGEAFFAPGLTATIREFNSFLPGEDPRDVDRLCRLMRTALAATGTAGMGYHAISGVEAALWDIVGKSTGLPIYQFLGGKYRDRVRIYADCHAGKGLASLSPVLLPRTPSWAATGRRKGNGRAELAPKFHGGEKTGADETRPEAYGQSARAMKRSGLTAAKVGVDVPPPFSELLEREAVDILAPDFQKVGGLLEGRRIADMADVHYVAVAPHNISSPIGTMASVHLCATIPNFLALEWHAASVPFFDQLIKGRKRPLIAKGYISVPAKPGLGIELDDALAYTYRRTD